MKSDKLQDAMGMIGDDLIERAKNNKKTPRVRRWLLAVACLAVVVLMSVIVLARNLGSDELPYFDNTFLPLADSSYPARVKFVAYGESENWREDYKEWLNDRLSYTEPYNEAEIDINDYLVKLMNTFLGQAKKNTVFSPINVYIALSMLAEISDTEGQEEILNLLNVGSIEELRARCKIMWNAHYYRDGVTTSILSNSLWLDENESYNQEMLNNLTENYFASVYAGEMGSDKMNNTIRRWIFEKTDGKLDMYGKNIKTTPNTIMALVSTLYFKAGWESAFSEKDTKKGYFYNDNYKMICDFMNSEDEVVYYLGDKFSAVELPLGNNCSMNIFLPDEGVGVNSLISDTQFLQAAFTPTNYDNKGKCTVNITLPKFDVSSETDMIAGLKKLGIKQVFDHLSPEYDLDNAYVDEIKHAARVSIDEEGCEGAAYTIVKVPEYGLPIKPDHVIQFNVNRPFLFVITSAVGAPLFTGVVYEV